MASLCHGSLAYCCPLSKRCAERDRALEVLGLTLDEYEQLKGDAHIKFVETAKGLSNLDPSWQQQASGDRLANRPATDPGYGSDDYRQDFESLDQAMQHCYLSATIFRCSSKRPGRHQNRQAALLAAALFFEFLCHKKSRPAYPPNDPSFSPGRQRYGPQIDRRHQQEGRHKRPPIDLYQIRIVSSRDNRMTGTDRQEQRYCIRSAS